MIGLTDDQLDSVLNKLTPSNNNNRLYQVVRYSKHDEFEVLCDDLTQDEANSYIVSIKMDGIADDWLIGILDQP